jgi:hypothetical protein
VVLPGYYQWELKLTQSCSKAESLQEVSIASALYDHAFTDDVAAHPGAAGAFVHVLPH